MNQNKKILILVSAFFLLLVVVTAWYLYTNLQNNKNYKEKTLEFQDITVTIRYKLEEGDDFFLDYPIKENVEKINNIEELFSQYGYLVQFFPDRYLSGESGGYKSVSIIRSDDFKSMKTGKMQDTGSDGYTLSTVCELSTISGEYTSFKCSKEVYNPEGEIQTGLGTTVSCFIKVNEDYYLSFDQPVKPVSTDVDMCELVKNHNVSVIK